MLNFIEILCVDKWQNRVIDIQRNWLDTSSYVEFTFNNLCIDILLNKSSGYFNIQNSNKEQVAKGLIKEINISKRFRDFLLLEPICSSGTTSYWSVSEDKINFHSTVVSLDEFEFISTFLNAPNWEGLLNYFTLPLPIKIAKELFDNLLNDICKGRVSKDFINEVFNIEINEIKTQELSQIGVLLY